MKAEDIEFNVGDIVYAAKGQNRLTGDLGKERSTKARAVFTTIEDAFEYFKNKDK